MFGLTTVMNALKNLTSEITRTTSLFKAANDQLEARFVIDPSVDEVPELPSPAAHNNGNGHAKRIGRAKVTA